MSEIRYVINIIYSLSSLKLIIVYKPYTVCYLHCYLFLLSFLLSYVTLFLFKLQDPSVSRSTPDVPQSLCLLLPTLLTSWCWPVQSTHTRLILHITNHHGLSCARWAGLHALYHVLQFNSCFKIRHVHVCILLLGGKEEVCGWAWPLKLWNVFLVIKI